MFSDEKRWTLDGPDGDRGYWRDSCTPAVQLPKRSFGGGGVMIWAAFHSGGVLDLHFVTGRLNGPDYQQILAQHLLPFLNTPQRNGYSFVQDNAPCHVSNGTKQWMAANGINTIDWPACSPDCNPIENFFGLKRSTRITEGSPAAELR